MIKGCRTKCKGVLDANLKDKIVTLQDISDEEVIEIKQILTEEIKRQKEFLDDNYY
jgi:predicted metal-binding transcription factor (methanogenesis marker protein 9)